MAHSLPGRLLALAAALAAGAARAALPDPWADAPPQAILLYDDPAPGATSLPWRLENRGGERAEDVAVFAEPTWRDPADGPAALSDPVSLEPGEAVEATFELGPPPGPGVWFVPIRVAGWDAAGHPTRSWRCPRFSVPAPKARPPVAFLFSSESTNGRPRGPFGVRVELRSLSGDPVETHVRVLVPSGLEPDDPPYGSVRIDAALAPGEAFATNVSLHVSSPFAQEATVRAVAWTAPATNAPAWGQTRFVRFDVDAQPGVLEPPPRRLPWGAAAAAAVWFAACAALGARRRRRNGDENGAAPGRRWEELAVVVAASAYLAWFLRAWLVFAPGLVLGGDLPAHHYLMDRIARTGRLVSWADGWWGGFPMFRYYFPLPYAAMAALGRLAGHDLAFKLGSIAGVLALPAALWGAARIARLPRPAPAFLAALALPLALDNTHNMWGANAYSTLAGMIANSWSFALFPVALALGARDARRERASAVSALVFAALALSHFFTSLLAALALGAFALALLAARRHRAFRALALEGVLAAALAAWWLLPLLATGGWSVAFGEQWDIRFWRQLPPMLAPAWLAAAAVAAVAATAMHNAKCTMQNADRSIVHCAFCILHFLLFAFSLLLFYFGRSVAEVFVNCRLWPFLVYAMLVGVALAWAALARAWRAPRAGALAFLALCAALAWRVSDDDGNPAWACAQHARFWAEYNLRGVEAQPCGEAFFRLAERVRGRPGLVAWDMTDLNEALGSSRSFEALPYVAPGTRTLEGGIVNSALGSLAAYTVQGEISDAPAGWPLLVSPREFDPYSGLRHLELLGVRTFIARSRAVQEAIEGDPAWTLLGAEGPAGRWKVYGSALEGAPDVRAWKEPLEVRSGPPSQREIADWWACRGATEHPVAFLPRPTSREADLGAWRDDPPPEPGWLDRVSDPVRSVTRGADGSLAFETDFPGRPHVVAATWYPDWRAEGAEGPYPLSSGQMVVYPTAPAVVLRHATLPSEIAGRILTPCGLLALAFLLCRKRTPREEGKGAPA